MVLIGSCMKSVCRVSGDVDCSGTKIFFLFFKAQAGTNDIQAENDRRLLMTVVV